jgi:hypothetical protein
LKYLLLKPSTLTSLLFLTPFLALKGAGKSSLINALRMGQHRADAGLVLQQSVPPPSNDSSISKQSSSSSSRSDDVVAAGASIENFAARDGHDGNRGTSSGGSTSSTSNSSSSEKRGFSSALELSRGGEGYLAGGCCVRASVLLSFTQQVTV